MGKQFSISATFADLEELGTILHDKNVSILSAQWLDDPLRLATMNSLSVPLAQAGSVSSVCYLKPLDSREIYLRKLSDVKVFVDLHRSELIQFIRPFYDGKVVGLGRLYYHDNYGIYGDNQLKSEEFRKWANMVFRVAKKALVREKVNGIYLGKEAATLITSGSITPQY